MAGLSSNAEFTVASLPSKASSRIRSLVFVYGDQLNRDSAAFDGFSPAQDAVFMAEVQEESTYAWSSKMRSSVFRSAMRHFAQALHDEGARICPYTTLYWDFLARHETSLQRNPRMALQVKNLARLDAATRRAIAQRAQAIRANGGTPPR